jgi:hypothetical protein
MHVLLIILLWTARIVGIGFWGCCILVLAGYLLGTTLCGLADLIERIRWRRYIRRYWRDHPRGPLDERNERKHA